MKFDFCALSVFVFAASALAMGGSQGNEQPSALTVPQQCAMYMSEEPVAKKLNLNSAQLAAYQHAVKAYVAESERLEKSKTTKDGDIAACDIKFAKACLAALNPAQKHVLLQVGIPRIGFSALVDPAVSTQVGLLPSQVKQITAICKDFAKKDEDVSAMVANAVDQVPEPKPGADRKKYDKKCAEISAMYNGERQRLAKERLEDEKRILGLLTPDQRAKWLDLYGSASKQ